MRPVPFFFSDACRCVAVVGFGSAPGMWSCKVPTTGFGLQIPWESCERVEETRVVPLTHRSASDDAVPLGASRVCN